MNSRLRSQWKKTQRKHIVALVQLIIFIVRLLSVYSKKEKKIRIVNWVGKAKKKLKGIKK